MARQLQRRQRWQRMGFLVMLVPLGLALALGTRVLSAPPALALALHALPNQDVPEQNDVLKAPPIKQHQAASKYFRCVPTIRDVLASWRALA